jgi:hypothetical protein
LVPAHLLNNGDASGRVSDAVKFFAEVGTLDEIHRLIEEHEVFKVIGLGLFQADRSDKFNDAGFREVFAAVKHGMQKTLIFKTCPDPGP